METIYSDADFLSVVKQRNKILGVFWGVTAAYVAFCVAWLVYHISLPYADPMLYLPKLCVYVASAAFVVFAFPFMGIKYHRVNRYYKFMYYVSEGLKNEEENYFVCFAKKDLQKDGVDVVSCVFKTWNKKKSEWMEREVYFDPEMDWPDLEHGDRVRYVVQSNFLIQYDVIERGALKDEDEEYEDEEN